MARRRAKDRNDAVVDWAMSVLREYVLAELKPQVVYVWMTEPDHIQHALGAGSPVLAARRWAARRVRSAHSRQTDSGIRPRRISQPKTMQPTQTPASDVMSTAVAVERFHQASKPRNTSGHTR